MRMSDEELSALLREALDPGTPRPPAESVRELRRLVSTGTPRLSAVWFRTRLATATAVFLGVSGSAVGAAMANGATLPEPLRVVAHGIGLPVDSVGLARARTDADRLRRDLERGDRWMIPRDATTLESTFSGLSSGDRHNIDGEVDSLLERAGAYGSHGERGTAEPSPSTMAGATGSDGDGDRDGGTSATPTTVSGGQSTGSGDGGTSAATSSGGGGSDGGSPQTTTTSPPPTSGSSSTSSSDGGTSGGGTDGGSDGGSVTGSDGG